MRERDFALFFTQRQRFRKMDFRRILELPNVYHKFQEWGGFFGARLKAIELYVGPLSPGSTIFDIGCGPGHVLPHLDRSIDYHGFDLDEDYIDFATRHFGALGKFHLSEFDRQASENFGRADLIMMNGVLHHLSDEYAENLLIEIRESLKSDGRLFTLDGCLRPSQHPIAAWMHRNDRGEFVRDEDGYRSLLQKVFPSVEAHVREDLSWVPHTYCINVCRP
jgi:SAM-dependent methyltransferase